MSRYPIFAVVQQIDPPTPRPFRLLETYFSSDGPRTRMCDGPWGALEDAQAEVAARRTRAHPEKETA